MEAFPAFGRWRRGMMAENRILSRQPFMQSPTRITAELGEAGGWGRKEGVLAWRPITFSYCCTRLVSVVISVLMPASCFPVFPRGRQGSREKKTALPFLISFFF